MSLDSGLLVLVRRWIRLNATRDGKSNMTAEMFRDYILQEILPQVASIQTADYNPFTRARL